MIKYWKWTDIISTAHCYIKFIFDIVPNLFDVDEQAKVIYGYNGNAEDYFLRYSF